MQLFGPPCVKETFLPSRQTVRYRLAVLLNNILVVYIFIFIHQAGSNMNNYNNRKLCSLLYRMRRTLIKHYKKLSYRRETARCVVSIEILPIATQQCRNYLYDKS